MSTSNHAVLDILDLVRTSRQPKHSFFTKEALVSCPACSGKHRAHTYDENCLKKRPEGKESKEPAPAAALPVAGPPKVAKKILKKSPAPDTPVSVKPAPSPKAMIPDVPAEPSGPPRF